MDFYKHLNYSFGNEDWRVEEQALRVRKGDRVVCITASGDRPLHLLMTDCAEILSLDMNAIQNSLLDLKLTAIRHLDYESYLAFMGIKPSRHRYQTLKKLVPHLEIQAATYWLNQRRRIEAGVIFQGRVERLTKLSSKVFSLMRYQKIKRLFEFDNIEEQRAYVNRYWDTKTWRLFFEVMGNPRLSRFVLRDPGLNAYVDYTSNPGRYIYDRVLRYLNTHLAKESPLLQFILLGTVTPDAYLPYVTYEGYQKIRSSQTNITYRTVNVIEHLSHLPADSIDCFSLSDIASYMPQSVFEKLLRSVYGAARQDARFCLREFMSKRHIPEELIPHFQRLPELEQKLDIEEKNFVYRFMVGNIAK